MNNPGKSFFSFTVSRPVTIFMMVLAIFTFGYISLGKLPVNLLPEISYPTITVRTEYPGAGPEDVEERVSERIQEALSVLPGLQEISSISKPGLSDVTLEFAWGTNIAYATQNIREKLDRTFMPEDVDTPIILRYDPTLDPIMRIGVSGDMDLIRLRKIAEDEIQRRLETVEGVAAVKVRGGLEEEIHVDVDKNKIRSLNLNIDTLNQRLAAENVNQAAGTIKEGDTEYLVRTLNQFMDLDEIMKLIITRSQEGVVRLGSLATITRGHKEKDIVSRINGQESVEIQIFKEAGANIVTLSDKINNLLHGTREQQGYAYALTAGLMEDPDQLLKQARDKKEKERPEAGGEEEKAKEEESAERGAHGRGRDNRGTTQSLRSLETDPEIIKLQTKVDLKKRMLSFISAKLPGDLNIRILSDQSRFIKNSIDEVRSSAFLGGLLAVLILYLFLRKAGPTIIIALSIPISVIATFAPMFLTNTSLNIMSLGGLALGIGMLVDNSIIVLESIFRCREEGDTLQQAAVRGVSEIGGAAVASTLTTVAVFFPIAFVEGIAGQIFKDQALTVVFSLLTSLAVALFFIPMLASRQFGNPGTAKGEPFRFSSVQNAAAFYRGRQFRSTGFFLVRCYRFLRETFLSVVFLIPFLCHLFVELLGFILYWSGIAAIYLISRIIFLVLGFFRIFLWPFTFCFDKVFQVLISVYPPFLRFVLVNKAVVTTLFIATLALLYVSFSYVKDLGQEILPEVHQGELIAHLSLHVGAPLEQTDRIIARAEEESLTVADIEWISSTVGIARDEISDADEGEHTARIYIKIKEGGRIQEKEERVLLALRQIYSSYPEILSCQFSRPTLFSIKAPVQVEVKGINLDDITAAGREVEGLLEGIPGLEDVKSSIQRGRPEVRIRFHREKLARYGLDTATLAQMISEMVKGKVPTRFMRSEHKIDILVRVDQEDLACVGDLADMIINPQSPAPLPLSAVADIQIVEGPSEIRRIWGQRAAIVSANLSRFDMGGTAERISATVSPLQEKTGLTIEIGGQGKDLESAMNNMNLALYLAIFLVYIVMASQFESLFQPFIIICSIPLALVGVVFVLHWLNINISVVVFIGGIMLAGIVVNNAIVLVDYINQLRRRGMDKIDAIVQACKVRFRPILMTTATTVLGLLPLTGILGHLNLDMLPISLGMGEGEEIRAPMAITVISGLISSTLLTLLIIPVVYSVSDRLFSRMKKIFQSTE